MNLSLVSSQSEPDLVGTAAAKPIQNPRREILVGSALAGVLVLGLGIWATTAKLDAAVVSQGVLRGSGGRHIVQAPAAGIVSKVQVVNGDRVVAGEILVQLATADAVATERTLAVRTFRLLAEIARIRASLAGQSRVDSPAEFESLTGEDRKLALDALALEQSLFDAQHSLDRTEVAAAGDRGRQASHQIQGYQERLASSQRQSALYRDELSAYEQLLAKGLATKSRVLALQRSAAALEGDNGAIVAEIARLKSQAAETRLELSRRRNERTVRDSDRLRVAETELQAAMPQWRAAANEVERTMLRAPFAGTVTGLRVTSGGGVVGAGAPLLELVPSKRTPVVEARVPVDDAAELAPGKTAQLRLVALHGRTVPPLEGVVQSVSADTIEDEKTGRSFYVVSLSVSEAALARVAKVSAIPGGIRAGMPVEVIITTQPRSAWDFLVAPLTTRMSTAFTQR